MKSITYVLFCSIFFMLTVGSLCASGEAEQEPVFDPARPGWQGVSIRQGFDNLTPLHSRFFHSYIKSISGFTKQKFSALTRDFIGPAFELYAAGGVAFTLNREKGRDWEATLAVLKGTAELSLLRAVIYKKKDYGDNRLVTFKVTSYDKPFPQWERDGKKRYVFRGVWNLSPADLQPNGAFDLAIAHALERMVQELGPGTEPPLRSGRVYLLEYRFLYVSRDTLGLYCKLAVEGE